MRKLFDDSLKAMGGAERDAYLIDAGLIRKSSPESPVTMIHPFLVWDYDKPAFKKEIVKLGWTDPELQDHNSSNCLLNGFANQTHIDAYGFHPYAFEIAGLVRTGVMTREEGLEKIEAPQNKEVIKRVKEKLGLRV